MKRIFVITCLLVVLAGCGEPRSTPEASQVISPTSLSTQVTLTFSTTTPSSIFTATPANTLTRTPTQTRTPYPIPAQILTREELQTRLEDWNSGKIVVTDADRLLDQKTGEPLRMGLFSREPFNEVLLIFYNLGFSIIEDEKGEPFLLNLVGFELGQGKRFVFPFHDGRLFDTNASLFLREYKGNQINKGIKLFSGTVTPMQLVKKRDEVAGFINLATTTIGGNGRGDEGDYFMYYSKDVTAALATFLECTNCSISDSPGILKKYFNQIPAKFQNDLPYLWVYTVSY
jgi:hypothetical protein